LKETKLVHAKKMTCDTLLAAGLTRHHLKNKNKNKTKKIEEE